MKQTPNSPTAIGQMLLTNRFAQVGEILVLFGVAFLIIWLFGPFAGENPLLRQGVIWVANVFMIGIVWLGLRLRGQGWADFGLHTGPLRWRAIAWTIARSFIVFVIAVAAFVLGAIVMANLVGIPEPADMSGYNYLRGNLPALLLALVGVYIVSSFGEEVIYRAFLITRFTDIGGDGRWARWIAVLLSSIIFGLIHYDWGLMGVVQTGFMGLALGISYLVVGRNLWVLILAHGYMDTILLVQQYLAP